MLQRFGVFSLRYNEAMSAALGLFRLQQVDTRISQIETRLRKIQETLDNDSELQAAMQKLRAAEQAEHHLEQQRRAAEEGAREQRIKIQQAESNLYGGNVQNPKELRDLEADVASLKKHLASIEEQELEAMVRLDDVHASVQSARTELETLRSRLGAASTHLLDEQASLARQLDDLQTERQAAVQAIDARLLRTYDGLREQRRGVAVVEISDNACGACGTTLTAALQQNARHSAEPVVCPSCGRILYAV
jgi:predicted  nucleic acid-binding Zn-ribbon protein